MSISLETFASQYLEQQHRGAAIAALAQHKATYKPLADWQTLWKKALAQPAQ